MSRGGGPAPPLIGGRRGQGEGSPSPSRPWLARRLGEETPPPSRFPTPLACFPQFLVLAVWLSNWTFDFSVLGFNLILYLGQQEHLVHDAIIPICNDTFMYPSPPECRTIRNLLEHSRWKHRNHSRTPKRDFPYMNLILRTIPDHLVISRIPSETPNNIRSLSHNTITTQTTSNP